MERILAKTEGDSNKINIEYYVAECEITCDIIDKENRVIRLQDALDYENITGSEDSFQQK